MATANTQNQEIVARQVIRALKTGDKIVDSLAKKDGKWRTMVRPADEMLEELYAYAEECKREESGSGK